MSIEPKDFLLKKLKMMKDEFIESGKEAFAETIHEAIEELEKEK